jgi:ribosomal subunit interface protein
MQISTTARHCRLEAEDRAFAQERVERFGKFARDIREVHVIVTAEGYRHRAEITLRLKHHELVGHEDSTEPRKAIDMAAGRVEEQLRRLKEKRIQSKRGSRPVNGEALAVEGAAADGAADEWVDEDGED